MVHAAMTAVPPTFTNFLKLNSNPRANNKNTTHESPAYEKRGYLNHEFRLFHLRGQMDTPVAYHYHDFHKVLILLNGEADYIVEGRSYHLRPLDIVLVGAHCLHKPVVPYKSRYERIILYLSPEFVVEVAAFFVGGGFVGGIF